MRRVQLVITLHSLCGALGAITSQHSVLPFHPHSRPVLLLPGQSGGRNVITHDGNVVLADISESVGIDNTDKRGTFLQLPRPPRKSGGREKKECDLHSVSLGRLVEGGEWLGLARMKLWWLSPHWGGGPNAPNTTRVPPETSFLLVNVSTGGREEYCLLLPLNTRNVRASLSGSGGGEGEGKGRGGSAGGGGNALFLRLEEWRVPEEDGGEGRDREEVGGGGRDVAGEEEEEEEEDSQETSRESSSHAVREGATGPAGDVGVGGPGVGGEDLLFVATGSEVHALCTARYSVYLFY
jgi:hypothetical protein